MTDKAWKQFERRIAKRFGGKRRGAYTTDGVHNKSDVILDGWSIECKLLSRPTYQQMCDAADQAVSAKEKEIDIAVAVVKKKNKRDDDALVIMRLSEFEKHFVATSNERMK